MKPIERVEEIIKYKGISISGFEKLTGMSNNSIQIALKRKTSLKDETLNNILIALPEISAEWLLTGKGNMIKQSSADYKIQESSVGIISEAPANYGIVIPLIPLDAAAGFGKGDMQISKDSIIDGYVIPEFTQKGVEFIIRVDGSSMYPKYSSGDLLGCRKVTDMSFFQWGKPYVLDTDQGPMVKRLYPAKHKDEIVCHSDNEKYPPFTIKMKSIFTIAIVIGVLRME